MQYRPLAEWDEQFVLEVAKKDESLLLEKKSSLSICPSIDWNEIAKQVCAFANGSTGFLVFGVDKTGNLDDGVPLLLGRTAIADVISERIAKSLIPQMTSCQFRHIRVANRHEPDRGVLIVEVPLSESRPHWIRNDKEESYIRVDRHSLPLGRRLFLDLASRGTAPQGEIVDFGVFEADREVGRHGRYRTTLNPRVRLVSGPICHHWAFDLRITGGTDGMKFRGLPDGAYQPEASVLCISGDFPLFPHCVTRVARSRVTIESESFGYGLTASLSLESSPPVVLRRSWPDWTRSLVVEP